MIGCSVPGIWVDTNNDFRPKVNGWQASLGVSVFLVLFANRSFWQEVMQVVPPAEGNLFFFGSLFLFLVFFLQFFLLVLSVDYIFKPAAMFILMLSAIAAYFMDTYGIMIDRGMVRNTLETDVREVHDLLSLSMIPYLVCIGFIPSYILSRIRLHYLPWKQELLKRLGLIFLNFVILVSLLFMSYGDFLDLGKNHKYVRHMINPVNSIYAVSSYLSRLNRGPKTIQPIGLDAKMMVPPMEGSKKNLFIFVLGETARAKNFSLNGYGQKTNPLMSQEAVFNFTDFYSCGTATAYSLPCIFSPLGRYEFRPSRAKRSEGLLDVLNRAGVEVLWRDNQSGCKGTCDRVPNERMRNLKVEGLCEDGECFDMVMLEGLQNHIDQTTGDMFIVLHQMGSHGPAYYKRYPKEFAVFTPECETGQLQQCTKEELVNTYDNTILYTDYFLSEVVALLKENNEQYNTAMMYVSDHGESLGENNIYLHGMPYLIAPDEQKHVPFMTWFSDSFMEKVGLTPADLKKREDENLSQDIIFHTVIGAMGVKTKLYDRELDLLATSVAGAS